VDIALLRDVSPEIARCELTYLQREPIDYPRAVIQHEAYAETLRAQGLSVISLPGDPAYPDCCFVEDAAIVLDELAVITRPGVESRRGETAAIAEALASRRKLVPLEAPATLDGGDVLHVGRRLFVGLSPRTNEAGLAGLRASVSPHGYEVIAVGLHGCLHLKSGVTALDDRTLLANPAWLDMAPFAGFDVVAVHADEPWAANVLRVRDRLLAHSGFERTRAAVEARGFAVAAVDVSEFLKAEAGVTCKSLIFRG
jgi:dimethylargininase